MRPLDTLALLSIPHRSCLTRCDFITRRPQLLPINRSQLFQHLSPHTLAVKHRMELFALRTGIVTVKFICAFAEVFVKVLTVIIASFFFASCFLGF